MISPPSTPKMAQPRICCVSASTMAFMKPRVSPVSSARGTSIHGHFRHAEIAPLFSGLGLAHANTPKLGIDEDGIGDQAILRAGAAMLQQVGAQNADVIVRDVGERRAPFHITNA